ncbi:hypothetical protein UlMin_007742 [Ulmus minor]
MATSAFKSTTKRTPIGASSSSVDDSSSSNRNSAHRRSRSLSRFSHRLPAPESDDFGEVPASKGKFVNTVRGSGFPEPEISLDDLAVEFFGSGDRGRSGSRNSETSPASVAGASQRRGRSVSRPSSRLYGGGGEVKGSVGNSSGGGRVGADSGGGNARRRRSVSVVRYQISDSESDLDHNRNRNDSNRKSLGGGNNPVRASNKPKDSNHRQGLRKSFSQKDLKSYDDYSSHSSVLTDDEGRNAHSSNNGIERTIRAVYAQKKGEHPCEDDMKGGLYEAMRKELRNAVEEMRTEFEQAMRKTNSKGSATGDSLLSNSSDVIHAVSSVRRNYSTKLEESEKRKQELLSEILLEEQRSRELSMIVKELLPEPKSTVLVDKPSRVRRRSTDKNRMSRRLTEEAEKYIEDFISNVEDTDISSLDGERSDTSSSIGGVAKTQTCPSPAVAKPLPVDADGVLLPWLQWETSNDASLQPSKNKMESPMTPKTILFDAAQEVMNDHDQCNFSASSHGSWSPGIIKSLSRKIGEDVGGKLGDSGGYQCSSYSDGPKEPRFDMEEYLKLQKDDDLLFERFRQQHRINSGSLLLCSRMYF